MANDSKDTVSIPPTVWVALLATLLGGFAARQLPFQDVRPPAATAPIYTHIPPDGQDVEARLWEDPLSAVAIASAAHEAAHGNQHAVEAEDDPRPRHSIEALKRSLHQGASIDDRVLILTALVSGAPYAEDVEGRRRTRYAVLAGLYQGGFVPDDSGHIGYIRFDDAPSTRNPPPSLGAYEWFRQEGITAKQHTVRVLLLWLDQDAFRQAPVSGITSIVRRLRDSTGAAQGGPTVTTMILGPADSDALQAMAAEVSAPSFTSASEGTDGQPSLVIYSPRATASDAVVLADAALQPDCGAPPATPSQPTLGDQFANWTQGRIQLYRTVATDDRLVCRLSTELQYRGVKAASEIALVAERDTLYARQMKDYFLKTFTGSAQGPHQPEPLMFTYLRGLDGLVPPAPTADSLPRSQSTPTTQSTASPPPVAETADGQGQLDYLRRLAARLASNPIDSDGKPRRIKAIGVLGSDVYDKILVLQALRSEFPNAIFFTTDLDARLLDSQSLPSTRQLVVASSLGLSLDARLQAGIAPFRDTYQSATYFSVLLGLRRWNPRPGDPSPPSGHALNWTRYPRIFEIGRGKVFDLTAGSSAPLPSSGCDMAGDCNTLSTPQSNLALNPRRPWTGLALAAGMAIPFSIMAWAGLGTAWLRKLLRITPAQLSPGQWWDLLIRTAAGLAAVILVSWGLWWSLATMVTDHDQRIPPPIFAGESRWSATILEAFSTLAVIALVMRGQRKLDQNADEVGRTFRLPTGRKQLVAARTAQLKTRPTHIRFRERYFFSVHQLSTRDVSAPPSPGPSGVEALIGRYLYRGTAAARLPRVTAATLLVTALVILMELLFAGRSFRGVPWMLVSGSAESQVMAWISLVSLFSMSFLILWVADATLLSRAFLLELLHTRPAWPATAIETVQDDLALTRDKATLWLDIQLVAVRTDWVSRLIWYPSTVLVITSLATLTVEFGQFGYANSPIAVIASGALIIVVACMLRAAAEGMRAGALKELDDAGLRSLGVIASAGERTAQLDRLRQRIENYTQGAFAPFSQQPFVRAVLVPLTTYAATTVLSYLKIPQ